MGSNAYSSDFYNSLLQAWGNNPFHGKTSDGKTTPMTDYQKKQLELSKTEEANKLTLQRMKMKETEIAHQAAIEDRRFKMAIDLQAKVAAYEERKEQARQRYYKLYEDSQAKALKDWEEESKLLNTPGSAIAKGAAKERQNAIANFIKIVENRKLETQELKSNQLAALTNLTDENIRKMYYNGLRPAVAQEVVDWVRQFNSLPSADKAKKLSEYKAAQKNFEDVFTGTVSLSADQIKQISESRAKDKPRLISEDPISALRWTNMMTRAEVGQNPYAGMQQAYAQAYSTPKTAQTQSPLQIGGYFSGSQGTQAIPVSGASDEDVALINKYNVSDQAKSYKTGPASNEEMAARVQKFMNSKGGTP